MEIVKINLRYPPAGPIDHPPPIALPFPVRLGGQSVIHAIGAANHKHAISDVMRFTDRELARAAIYIERSNPQLLDAISFRSNEQAHLDPWPERDQVASRTRSKGGRGGKK